jgi:hypothetical protein
MTKFIIDVSLDGYDTEEEMIEHCDESVVEEALRNYGFMVNYVRWTEE